MAGFYVGLFLLALFLVGTIIYMLISGNRPGQRNLDASDGTRSGDADQQAELYERPHHEQHKHHDGH